MDEPTRDDIIEVVTELKLSLNEITDPTFPRAKVASKLESIERIIRDSDPRTDGKETA